MVRGLLLDFDGTLCDSLGVLLVHFKRFMVEQGTAGSDADFDRLNGLSIRESMARLVAEGTLSGDEEHLASKYREGLAETINLALPAAGARELLDFADDSGLKVAIVTSGRSPEVVHWLSRHGFTAQVKVVVGIDEVGRGKPHPEPYLKALDELALSPSDCVAVEDTEMGAIAACKAGLETLLVTRTDLPGVIGVDGLPGVLAELRARCCG